MKQNASKVLAMLLAVVMLVGVLPMNIFAAIDFNPNGAPNDG